jgi:hypothetical protein
MRVKIATSLWVAAALVFAAPAAPGTGARAPSYGNIGGIFVGESKTRLAYRYVGSDPSTPTPTAFRVPGGVVHAYTKAYVEGGGATETGRVVHIDTCDPVWAFPDGVRPGAVAPYGKRWKGYTLGRVGLAEALAWQKTVTAGGKRLDVTLFLGRGGRIGCVSVTKHGVESWG